MTVIYVEETIRCCPWQAQAWFAFSPTWPTFDCVVGHLYFDQKHAVLLHGRF